MPLLINTLIPIPPEETLHELSDFLDAADQRQSAAIGRVTAARDAVLRLRRVILAAACSGRLTADWRRLHPDVESLEHVLTEAEGSRRKREVASQGVELRLPELPATYVVSTIGACAEVIEYGTSRPCSADPNTGMPVLRMGNIQDGALDLGSLKYCAPDAEIRRLTLRDGDLLFNRTNSPELVGKAAVFHDPAPMSFASYIIRVRFNAAIADPDYVSYWINSAWGREWARLAKTDGVSQSNINGSKLSLMPIPLAPVAEQRVTVERASRMLTRIDELEDQIDAVSSQLSRISRAILDKAFRGELGSTANSQPAATRLSEHRPVVPRLPRESQRLSR
jgi:type I restriction enzyme S subunit